VCRRAHQQSGYHGKERAQSDEQRACKLRRSVSMAHRVRGILSPPGNAAGVEHLQRRRQTSDTSCPLRSVSGTAERCWSGRTGLPAKQFHPKRVTGVRIPPSPPEFSLHVAPPGGRSGQSRNGYAHPGQESERRESESSSKACLPSQLSDGTLEVQAVDGAHQGQIGSTELLGRFVKLFSPGAILHGSLAHGLFA
jgi:hypothetical protein